MIYKPIVKHKVYLARKPITTEKFIEESKKLHGDKYDYNYEIKVK